MNQSITDYQKELKTAKKKCDKIVKQIKRCTSDYQYNNLLDELEIYKQDVYELEMIISDLKEKKKFTEVEV